MSYSLDLLVFLVLPAGLAAGGGALQGRLAARRSPLVFLLPPLAGGATLFCLLRLLSETGLSGLVWLLYLFWAGCAFAGTLLGWFIGVCVRTWKEGKLK